MNEILPQNHGMHIMTFSTGMVDKAYKIVFLQEWSPHHDVHGGTARPHGKNRRGRRGVVRNLQRSFNSTLCKKFLKISLRTNKK